jgi:PDZ domain-containing protein
LNEVAAQPSESGRKDQGQKRGFSVSYLLIPVILLALAAAILELIPADSYILLPGQALQVAPMISVHGFPTRHKTGRLYMVDVSLYKADHLLEQILYSRLYSGADVEPASSLTGGLSDQQYSQVNVAAMSDSIREAEAAALSLIAGLHPRFASTGPLIDGVLSGTPAARKLRVGDVVEYVDEVRVQRRTQIAPLVHLLHPGQIVHLRVLRRNRLVAVDVGTIASTNGLPDKHGKTPLMGIQTVDQFVLPIKIAIRPGDIQGPSAGLMFSLGIIQQIQQQDIARGCAVAGTGTIDLYGNVGPIGGVKQKIIAAENAGAKYFLVPNVPENVNPAMQYRHNITVVPVTTLQQAIAFLRAVRPCASG